MAENVGPGYGGGLCTEIDLFEANNNAMQACAHGCTAIALSILSLYPQYVTPRLQCSQLHVSAIQPGGLQCSHHSCISLRSSLVALDLSPHTRIMPVRVCIIQRIMAPHLMCQVEPCF
jgi:hypothetical protein